jgi:hypothetical protein
MLPRKWAWPEFTMGKDAKLLLDTILYGGAAKLHAIAPSSHSLPPSLGTPFFFFFFFFFCFLLSLNWLFVFLSSLHNCTIDFELGFVSTSKNETHKNIMLGLQHLQPKSHHNISNNPKSHHNTYNPNLTTIFATQISKSQPFFFGCKPKKSQHNNNFCCLQKRKTQISKSQQHFVTNQNLVLASKCEEGSA